MHNFSLIGVGEEFDFSKNLCYNIYRNNGTNIKIS